MATHVALLRAVNVGGRKIAMADLRDVVRALGHTDVRTYIQSGNVVFSPARDDAARVGADLEAAVSGLLGAPVPVVVLSRADLAAAIADNPYPTEPDPRRLHGVFLPADPAPDAAGYVREAVTAVTSQGSGDTATLRGRVLYLHTPAGFGGSPLARSLLGRRGSPVAAGTARSWATITRLLALCEAAATGS
ncbi:MAG: DUF1697 domain-containing protein [Streptosporangiaceae bacterium]